MSDIQIDKDCSLDEIRHSGIVKHMDDRFVYVSIVAQSACNACHAKGICNVSDLKEEVVEVPRIKSDDYKVGDNVEVLMEKSLGTKAVLLGYLIPFAILLVTLIVALNLVESEGLAGLIALLILVPYYSVLYVNRTKLKNTFVFRIK